jgi:hypothetical protein
MVSWQQRYTLHCLRTDRRWQYAETASSDVGAIMAYDWVTFTKPSSVEAFILRETKIKGYQMQTKHRATEGTFLCTN